MKKIIKMCFFCLGVIGATSLFGLDNAVLEYRTVCEVGKTVDVCRIEESICLSGPPDRSYYTAYFTVNLGFEAGDSSTQMEILCYEHEMVQFLYRYFDKIAAHASNVIAKAEKEAYPSWEEVVYEKREEYYKIREEVPKAFSNDVAKYEDEIMYAINNFILKRNKIKDVKVHCKVGSSY